MPHNARAPIAGQDKVCRRFSASDQVIALVAASPFVGAVMLPGKGVSASSRTEGYDRVICDFAGYMLACSAFDPVRRKSSIALKFKS